MDPLTMVMRIVAVAIGFATPILYRRLRGGPWHFSGDGCFSEGMGFFLSMLVTTPVELLVIIIVSPLLTFSETDFYAGLTILNLGLGFWAVGSG